SKANSSLCALAVGLEGTDWELGFKQFSFYHIMQVLRIYDFSTFSSSPAFPPCSCPRAFRHEVRRLTYRMSSESYPGNQECVVSYHGAGWASSTRPCSPSPRSGSAGPRAHH